MQMLVKHKRELEADIDAIDRAMQRVGDEYLNRKKKEKSNAA